MSGPRSSVEARFLHSETNGGCLYFETVVRVHRAGEGAPFTGLKAPGHDYGPAIAAADKALDTGNAGALMAFLTTTVSHGIRERFNKVTATSAFRQDAVHAGREYVKAYIEFIHYVERLYAAAVTSAHGHFAEK